MDELKELITWLQGIILAAATPRAILCGIKINSDSDNAPRYKLHLKHLLEFVVISIVIMELLKIISNYF